MQLSALEAAFRSGIIARDDAILGVFKAGNLSEKKRLEIYRNNVFSNYRSALESIYPAILSLVGVNYFRQAAQRYVEHFPSMSGDIHYYGENFSALLASLPGAADLAYLPDVARLEWSIHAAFHAADHAPLDLSRLQSIAPEEYGNLRFVLNPATRLLSSEFPIRRIWQVNLPEYVGDQRVDLSEGGEHLLVMRRNYVMEVEAISAADWAILRAFPANEKFVDALDVAIALDAEFDAGAFMQRYALNQTISDFNLS